MGGWYHLAKRVAKAMKLDSKIATKGLRRVQQVGMVAGTGMLVGGLGYHTYYAFVDSDTELDIPKERITSTETGDLKQSELSQHAA